MKRHSIATIFLLIVMFAGCGPGFLTYTTTADRFQRAEALYEQKSYAEARTIFREIADDNFGHSIYPRAEFNDAYTSWLMEDYDRAEEHLLGLLKLDLDDLEPSGNAGIMDEPYANYKHRICLILAEIYIATGRFADAKRYVGLADSVHIYQHFCGNEMMGSSIAMKVLYSRCDEGLGDTIGALRPLLSDMLYNGLSSPIPLARRVVEIMKHRYLLDERRYIIEHALAGMRRYIEKTSWETRDGYAITLFDTDVFVPVNLVRYHPCNKEEYDWFYRENKSLDEVREEFRLTPFYRRLLELE